MVGESLKDLCIDKLLDLIIWVSEVEEKLAELDLEVERLRAAVRDLGHELGLE